MSSDWIVKNLYWLVPSLLVAIGGIATFIRWLVTKPKASVESIQQTASPSLAQTANPNYSTGVRAARTTQGTRGATSSCSNAGFDFDIDTDNQVAEY
ncbi:MAG: hypothetical protein WB723_04645 [Candidatus Acidiferrales bacterium]